MDTAETITHISLCAGYGGIDLGLKRCMPTLRTVLVSEIEAFAVANLVAKMEAGELDPCPIWSDLKTLPLHSIPENISILSGGFPCQPFSAAGKRAGDEDPRHLFPYIKNAIRIIQPRIVFLENVEGIISAKLKGNGWEDPAGTPVLLHVLRELERVGYAATWGIFSAAEVGAPHQRKRVFILAHSRREHREVSSEWGLSTEQITGDDGETRRAWPARPGEPQHEWEEPRVVADAEVHGGRNLQKRSETFRPEQQSKWQTESQLGGTVNGPASGLDATTNRVDRLRLLGNGVVPDTAEVAFRTLYKELTEQ